MVNSKSYYKCCPHCKGTKGFEISIRRGGYYTHQVSFDGKIIDTESSPGDDIENWATCLDCGHLIDNYTEGEGLNLNNI